MLYQVCLISYKKPSPFYTEQVFLLFDLVVVNLDKIVIYIAS